MGVFPDVPSGSTMSPDRPNILFILSDQHAPQYAGFSGHPLVKTPHLDQLATEGIVFDAAYCNSPLCVPSRMSLVTGRYCHNIEQWDNDVVLSSKRPTYAAAMREAGYDAVLAGKMHFYGEDQLHGFRAQLSYDMASANPRNAPIPNWDAGGEVPGHSLKSLPARSGSNKAAEADDAAVEAFLDYLQSREAGSDPWCFTLGLYHPHRPWGAEPEFWDLYDPDEIALPEWPEGHLETMHPAWRRRRALHGQPPDRDFPDDERRNAIHGYFASISRVDHLVGRVLTALREAGCADQTLVIYSSDHGEMLGEHGMWMKSTLCEPSARVPLILRWPDQLPSGERRPGACSLVDVTATMLAAAGVDTSGMPLDGDSLLECARSSAADWKDEAFCEHTATWVDRPTAMIRRGRHKLIASHDEPCLLFDVESDPGELNNLFDDPKLGEVREDLLGALRRQWYSADIHRRVLASQHERRAKAVS